MLTALYADKKGNIFDAPGCRALGAVGSVSQELSLGDMILLPDGADLMYLPGRQALGTIGGWTKTLDDALAVAAILPVGYTRTHLPAFHTLPGAPVLPLYGYTAVAFYQGNFYVAAVKSDDNKKWDPKDYNTKELKRRVKAVKKDLPGNRIVKQLADCSLLWHCCTAENLFYRRWEAGLPVSPVCNAHCLGCISLQPAECCPSAQNRISFKPTVEEIAEVGIYHLTSAEDAIISFGQGCEGEPSLGADRAAPGIEKIRRQTSRGIININTNAGYTAGIKKLVDSGLDSMRVSIISAQEETYQAYYRSNYTLKDVKASIKYAKDNGLYVSLNMLLFPGLNDRAQELAAWLEFIKETGIDLVQLRNLNIDPEWFLSVMPQGKESLGVKKLLTELAANVDLGSASKYFLNQ